MTDDRMGEIVAYMAASLDTDLPYAVVDRAKIHILDTLAAMVSGSTIPPGRRAIEYARQGLGAAPEAHVAASGLRIRAVDAAMANGMLAHADETDDSHGEAGMHPGCAIVPAGLAMGERHQSSGLDMLRAIVLGYDIGARVNRALGRDALRARNHLPFSIGGTIGAAATAGAIARFASHSQYRYLLSYAAQQASGIMTYARDTEHIEKAFIFGGMPARNGVTAAAMVHAGFTGVTDVFSGDGNFLSAYAEEADATELTRDLGDRFEITQTNVKKYSVGFPIQAALEGLLALKRGYAIEAQDVVAVQARLPIGAARTVDNREMPNISLQYCFSIALLDGQVTFDAAHDVERMQSPEVRDLTRRISVVGDEALAEANYSAVVEIGLRDGRTVSRRVDSYRGKSDNPLSWQEACEKAVALIEPTFGVQGSAAIIEYLADLESQPSVGRLGELLSTLPEADDESVI